MNKIEPEDAEFQQAAIMAVQQCLREVPFIEGLTATPGDDLRPDIVFRVTLSSRGGVSQEHLIVAEVKASGQPRFARMASAVLHRHALDYARDTNTRTSGPPALLLVAPYISEAAAAICVDEGVNYIDLAGNCRLSFDGVFIERLGHANPHKRDANRVGLYAPKAERVLRALLALPQKVWHVRDLASEAGVSVGTVVDVRRILLDREWIQASRDGVRLTQPKALLGEWADRYDYRRNKTHDFYSLKPVAETEGAVAAACRDGGIPYALTGFSGAARYAPFVRYQKASLYVASDIDAIAEAAKLKRVQSGANVTLITPYDEGVFMGITAVGPDTIVSPLQAYLDLQNARSRGAEAAEYLYHQKIEPVWSTHHGG